MQPKLQSAVDPAVRVASILLEKRMVKLVSLNGKSR